MSLVLKYFVGFLGVDQDGEMIAGNDVIHRNTPVKSSRDISDIQNYIIGKNGLKTVAVISCYLLKEANNGI